MTDVMPNTRHHVPDLVPVRMLNEYAYCPRLCFIEWVDDEFVENLYTIDGDFVHRRVDAGGASLPAPSEEDGEEKKSEKDESRPKIARSVTLSAPKAGLIAKADLIEAHGNVATPVDTKRGKIPEVPFSAYEPERIQLCAQGLVLRENGFRCEHGYIYFAGSRERVEVVFDDMLVARTLSLLESLRKTVASGVIPPPLVDNPKCGGCSLAGICLPDEINMLRKQMEPGEPDVRPFFPARDDALPLYVHSQKKYLGKNGDTVIVKELGKKVAEVPFIQISQVCLYGNVGFSSHVMRELLRRDIALCHLSYGGWLQAVTASFSKKNIELRRLQYSASGDAEKSLFLSRRFVEAKILNCRTFLRRNHTGDPQRVLGVLADEAKRATMAVSTESLLGVEGTAARKYFSEFSGMLKTPCDEKPPFDFSGRNRRPPRDPVNALLSFAYSLLVKELTLAVVGIGFDPLLGFYHRPRYGRPALALDLMEEFRPLIADSVVITAINNGVIKKDDFIRAAGGVSLKPRARAAFINAYERRMDHKITHPVFGYRISYRRVLHVQARLLARFLVGEIPEYPMFLTR